MIRNPIATLVLAALLSPALAAAQCPNVGGSPQAEQYAANKVQLRYLSTGPGGGDDKPTLLKSLVMTTLSPPFDPINTHSVHVRFLLNGNQAQVMWDTTIPPNANWVHSGIKWTYLDTSAPFGVDSVRINDYGGSLLVVRYRGRNQNIAFAPVVPGTDNVTAEVEIFDGSNAGICYGGSTFACNGSGNTQTCRAL